MYEEEMNKQKRAHEAFKQVDTIEKGDIESKKPAFFQKDEKLDAATKAQRDQEGDIEPWRLEEYEAYKKLQQELEVNFSDKDNESHEKVREFFKIPKDKQVVNDMNEKVFDFLHTRMRDRQLTFYAFLNKEFNIMNYKSARCSMHCFDNEEKPLTEVNSCLKICRSGI